MENLFSQFSERLEQENGTREEIKKVNREIEQITRQMLFLLQQVHSNIAKGNARIYSTLLYALLAPKESCFLDTLSTKTDQCFVIIVVCSKGDL